MDNTNELTNETTTALEETKTSKEENIERRRARNRAKLENMTEEERIEHRKKVRRRKLEREKKNKVTEIVAEATDSEVATNNDVVIISEAATENDVVNVSEAATDNDVATDSEAATDNDVVSASEVATDSDVATNSEVATTNDVTTYSENMPHSFIDESTSEKMITNISENESMNNEVVHLDEIERNELKEFVSVVGAVMHKGLSNPIEAMKHAEESKYRTEFVFGGLFFILLFITTSIHLPILQSVFGILDRMKIAAITAGILFMIITAFASIIYVFVKKKEDIKFKTISSIISLSLIPGIFAIILVFILGYLSLVGVVLVIVINCIYWLLLCSQICTYYSKEDVFYANMAMVISSVIMFLILYFAVKLAALQVLNAMIYASSEAMQTSDGSIIGSMEIIVENLITFFRNVDTLLGN